MLMHEHVQANQLLSLRIDMARYCHISSLQHDLHVPVQVNGRSADNPDVWIIAAKVHC